MRGGELHRVSALGELAIPRFATLWSHCLAVVAAQGGGLGITARPMYLMRTPTAFHRSAHRRGFTLVELMIVIAIIAIIAAIAIPNLLAARLSANETAAIATIRNIVSAQAQFQQGGNADTNANGHGEYGGFAELSGALAGRMNGPLVPPVLSGQFRLLSGDGAISRSGYLFRMFLPSPAGAGVPEPTTGYADNGSVGANAAESAWCCYAWPVNYNQTGNRTFFTNQSGDVLFAEDPSYQGPNGGPPFDAAYLDAGSMMGSVAIGGIGADGNTWRQAN